MARRYSSSVSSGLPRPPVVASATCMLSDRPFRGAGDMSCCCRCCCCRFSFAASLVCRSRFTAALHTSSAMLWDRAERVEPSSDGARRAALLSAAAAAAVTLRGVPVLLRFGAGLDEEASLNAYVLAELLHVASSLLLQQSFLIFFSRLCTC